MSASNRQTLINQVYKVLKSHYKPVKPPADRTVLEHLLYACCLENAPYDAADEAFAKLQQVYFDWNEVRVTTVTELAETLSCLPTPSAAATRLKRSLQSVFESQYAFELEHLRKLNLGKAVKEVEEISGVTPFVVAYVSQHGLGGHAIPCSQGVFDAFEVLGIISHAEAAKQRVPGLERAIPKAKGMEFASLLHQLGADYFAARTSGRVQSILAEIAPEVKEPPPPRAKHEPEPAEMMETSEPTDPSPGKQPPGKPSAAKQSSVKPSAAKQSSAKQSSMKPSSAKQSPVKLSAAEQPVLEQPPVEQSAVEPSPVEPPAVDQPSVAPSPLEQPAVEPSAEPRSPVEPSPVEPSAVEPSAVEPSAGEQPSVEPSPLEQPSMEQSAAEPSGGEQSAGEQPAGEPSPESATGHTPAPAGKPAASKRPAPAARTSKKDVPSEDASEGVVAEFKKSTTKQLSRKKPR